MKKITALIIALLMLALALPLTSCGNTGKSVIIGYTIYEPMNYKDANGKLIGFDTELAEAVFKKLGYNTVFKEIDWDQKYSELNAGTIDCIWNGFTANTNDDDGTARSSKVDFSYNYMLNKQVVVAKTELASTVTSKDGLKDKVGAAEKGSAGYGYLDKLTGCIKKECKSQLDAIKELKLGTADFVVLDEQLADAYVGKGEYTGMAKIDAISSDSEYYAIGFKKGSDLTAKVNKALEELAADGTIKTLAEKYGVSVTAITDFSNQK